MIEPDDLPEQELFERKLEAAIARVAPPEGFAERVLARAYPATSSPMDASGRPLSIVARPRLWLALAACLLAAVLGLLGGQHRARERRRQEARARFEMSMAITRQTLEEVGRDTRRQLGAAGIQIEP